MGHRKGMRVCTGTGEQPGSVAGRHATTGGVASLWRRATSIERAAGMKDVTDVEGAMSMERRTGMERGKVVGRASAPPPRARPISLQASRAGLLKRLAREPAVSRSVGLVR
jgi:hypothetical protein